MSDVPATRNRSFSHQVDVVIESTGETDSHGYRIFSRNEMDPAYVSMWHDIPLHPTTNVVNMICEVDYICTAETGVVTLCK